MGEGFLSKYSKLINNDTVSDYFNLEQGERQGDPLYPYLFILAVETIALSICSNAIKGITIGNEETKLLQYADDTTAVLSDTNSYISSLLPTPQTIKKEVNQLIFNFLWKGKDMVTRFSTINTYEEGDLKMTDLHSMIKALRLSWLKRAFSSNKGGCKT